MKIRWHASFVLMLTLLFGSELVVRVFFARNMSGRFEYGYHPTAGFVEINDGTVKLVRAGGRRFHPQSFRRERPAGAARLMVIGDSVPRGPSLKEAYPARVAAALKDAGVPSESLNLAVPGFGARRTTLVLKQAVNYQPSVLILHLNDSNEFEDEREFRRSEEFKSWHPRHWLLKSLAIRRLYEAKTELLFWGWLPAQIRLQQAVTDSDAQMTAAENPARVRAWTQQVQHQLAANAALARARKIPLLVISQARVRKNAAGQVTIDDDGLDAMAETVVGNGVYHLSMKEVFAPLPYERMFADSAHLRKEGHQVLADAVIQKLRCEGLVR